MKTVTVFGALGRTGRIFTDLALRNGLNVKVLLRAPSRLEIQHAGLQIIQGDVLVPEKVEEAIQHTDAVIDLVGPDKESPPDLMRVSTQHILDSLQKNNVKRLIALASVLLGPLDTMDKPDFNRRFMRLMGKIFMRKFVEEVGGQVNAIKESNLDWTMVRAPMLSDEPARENYNTGHLDATTGKSISRADAAAFMLDVLINAKYIRQMPLISY